MMPFSSFVNCSQAGVIPLISNQTGVIITSKSFKGNKEGKGFKLKFGRYMLNFKSVYTVSRIRLVATIESYV